MAQQSAQRSGCGFAFTRRRATTDRQDVSHPLILTARQRGEFNASWQRQI
jgi:hypothetical protein